MIAVLLGVLALLAAPAAADLFPDCPNGPLANNTVCDTSASVGDRARALVAALTIDEKFNLTGNTSPGVARLGLYSYQWWREFVHTIFCCVIDKKARGGITRCCKLAWRQFQLFRELLACHLVSPTYIDGRGVR